MFDPSPIEPFNLGNDIGAYAGIAVGTKSRPATDQAIIGLPALDPETKEAWLFHGTTETAAKSIAESDFYLAKAGSNVGTLYGKGIYLAEHVTKSDEYAGERPKPRPQGKLPQLVHEAHMLVCRTTLGHAYYTDEAYPNPDKLTEACKNGGYSCVIGDRIKHRGTFREFVVFDDDLVYPEFIVTYRREFFHEKFADIYVAMFERRRKMVDHAIPTMPIISP